MNRDRILINGLRLFGYHGVNREEREQGQEFVVDVEAHMDLKEAGQTDLLGRTLDYDSLIKEITRVVSVERYSLIEAVAERIAEVVLGHRGVQETVVRVTKPNPPVEVPLGSIQAEVRRRHP